MSRWTRKPALGTPIDPGHPLSAGLIAAVLPYSQAPFDLAARRPWTRSDSSASPSLAMVPGRSGPALKCAGSSTSTIALSTLVTPAAACTILMVARPYNVNGSAFGSGDNAQRLHCHLPFSGGIFFDFGGGGSANRASWTPPTSFWGEWHAIALRAGPRQGISIWADGLRRNATTLTVARTATTGLTLGGFPGLSLYQPIDYEQFLMYDRELSDGDLLAWMARPYDLMRPAAGGLALADPGGVATAPGRKGGGKGTQGAYRAGTRTPNTLTPGL